MRLSLAGLLLPALACVAQTPAPHLVLGATELRIGMQRDKLIETLRTYYQCKKVDLDGDNDVWDVSETPHPGLAYGDQVASLNFQGGKLIRASKVWLSSSSATGAEAALAVINVLATLEREGGRPAQVTVRSDTQPREKHETAYVRFTNKLLRVYVVHLADVEGKPMTTVLVDEILTNHVVPE